MVKYLPVLFQMFCCLDVINKQMLGLHSLEHRRLYFDLVLLFKIVHGFSGLNMSDIGVSSGHSGYLLRNGGFLLHTDEVATCSVSMSSFVYRTIRLWNALPKSAYGMSLGAFKRFVINLDLIKLSSE